MAWSVGDRCGRYQLLRPLGRGGTGEVWEATLLGPSGFRKTVAIKLLREGARTEEAQANLRNEARIGARVSHPNIASTWELGEESRAMFLAMELVRGVTVSAFLRGGPLPPGVVLDIGIQVCAGLRHLHDFPAGQGRRGLVHRDIKPSNLLVDPHGCVKIADLGIVTAIGEQTAVFGTPGFAAPEQIAGAPVDGRADLFALGATLFAMATGTRLFERGTINTADVVAGRIAAAGLFESVDGAVAGLGPVLRTALSPRADDRHPSAAALSEALAALVHVQPAGPTVRDLVAETVRGGPLDDSTLRTPRASALPTLLYRGNLPGPRDAFFGREDLLAAVAGWVRDEAQLVVLHGPGGMGKTRLALEAARRLAPELPGSAWFFDLADARTVDGLCSAVARPLGIELAGGDPVDRLGRALGARGRALFVLDNLEQLAQEGVRVVAQLCGLAPRATFLCTSRLALGRGAVVEVGPLALSDAAELFVARAHRPCERDAVERIVDQIDRMPLAIELCAARTRWLSLPELEERLTARLEMAAGPAGDRPDRHRSVRAALDGSRELLDEEDRSALSQLSVFEGGFTISAAEAVLDVEGWALDVIQRLAEASLVVFDVDAGRFSLLRLVQDHAAEHLSEVARSAAEVRHGRYMAQLGSTDALAALHRGGGADRYDGLVAELDNLVVASDRAVARGDGPIAVHTALAAAQILGRLGPLRRCEIVLRNTLTVAGDRRSEVLELLADNLMTQGDLAAAEATAEEALAAATASEREDLAGRLRDLQARCARRRGDVRTAFAYYQTSLAEARAAGDKAREVKVLSHLGLVHLVTGPLPEADACFSACLASARSLGDRMRESNAMANLALVRARQGRTDEAVALCRSAIAAAQDVRHPAMEAHFLARLAQLLLQMEHPEQAMRALEAALERQERQGQRGSTASVQLNLGVAATLLGDLDRAVRHTEAALHIARELGIRPFESLALFNIGWLHSRRGDRPRARALLQEALALYVAQEDATGQSFTLNGLALLALRDGDIAEAAVRAEDAVAFARTAGSPRLLAAALRMTVRVARLRGAPGPARAILNEAVSAARTSGDRRTLLEVLCERACLEAETGYADRATHALQEAEALAARVAPATGSEEEEALAEARTALASIGT